MSICRCLHHRTHLYYQKHKDPTVGEYGASSRGTSPCGAAYTSDPGRCRGTIRVQSVLLQQRHTQHTHKKIYAGTVVVGTTCGKSNPAQQPAHQPHLYTFTQQDVVELMKESLYDLYLDDRGVVDFRRSGGKSKQAEAKRFLGALARRAEVLHNDGLFPVEELYSVADTIELQVTSMHEFIQQLNDAGMLVGVWVVIEYVLVARGCLGWKGQ